MNTSYYLFIFIIKDIFLYKLTQSLTQDNKQARNIMEQKTINSPLYVPLSQELAAHVKRLDGFNEEEIAKLRDMLHHIVSKETISSKDAQESSNIALTEQMMLYTLKVNQVFALLDVDLQLASEAPLKTLDQITTQLKKLNGLDYIPRERTPQGRLFEHASDTKVLLKLLQQIQSPKKAVEKGVSSAKTFYIKIQEERASGDSEVSTQEDPTKEKSTLFVVKKEFLDLTLKANGKADLYFHAYFWNTLSAQLYQKAHGSLDKFEADIITPSVEFKRLRGLADFLFKVLANVSKHTFSKDVYERYVNELGGKKAPRLKKLLEDIQKALLFALISDDKDSLHWIEKLLVQLLGYSDISVRDQAVVFLNMLYDGHDWQIMQAFKPVVRVVGQHFKVNIIVDFDLSKNQDTQIFIGLSAPSPIENVNQTVLTWHKIDQRNIIQTKGPQTEISINFGKFWKCGFYDWRIVCVKDNGRLSTLDMIAQAELPFLTGIKQAAYSPDYYSEAQYEMDMAGTQQAQGRFIVHAKGMRDHIFHEVYVDYQNAEVDTKEGKFVKRGDFSKVEKAIPDYKKRGISALYLMGALERDNNPYLNRSVNQVEYRRPDAAPLAITCRSSANKMLGGDEGFQRVMKQAHSVKVKIIVDCLTRISSSRSHRKYRDLMLYYLDEEGKRRICYGTDGQSINYEDSALLNYRKVEAWDLLIQEVTQFATKYGVNGIHLDNGQAWPQIMEVDLEELQRVDVDGQAAYTPMDVLNGEIVIRNENCGYWNTNTMETYANPFFIKMCRALWEAHPDFMVIGECWGGYKFENRHILLSRSGIIPRMFKLPQAICSIFGKRLFKDGRLLQNSDKDNVKAINDWYEKSRRQFMPEGSILLQSSTAHQWPYPAYMYGKGSWAAVDILYFMPDVPITFMGEIDGEVYRIETTKVFQHEMQEATTSGSGLKRTNSQLMMMLKDNQDSAGAGDTPQSKQTAVTNEEGATPQKGLVRVRSGSNLAALVVETKSGQDIKVKEEKFKAEVGPQQGFDLSQINTHYEHRRRLRKEKMVLRYGEFIPLIARSERGLEERVLTFARYSLQETAIIATNLNDYEVQFYADLSPLKQLYLGSYKDNTVIMVTDWLKPENPAQYYFLKELLNLKQHIRLRGYKSSVLGFTICSTESGDSFVVKKALQQSLERTKAKLASGQSIESEQISLLVTDILETTPQDIVKFANVIGSLQEQFLDKLPSSTPLTFYDLWLHNHKLRSDATLSSRMLALSQRVVEIAEKKSAALPPVRAAQSIVETNKLGPIVFCTPELGRWSTVGGLGVMVDELAYGLALLGQEVWVISPYYERNRKGETGYLAKDPAGIEYKENISVTLNAQYTLGVHEGEVHGVKVIFLHNSEIFPVPYADSGCADVVKQLAVFGKACLEFCCARQIIPSVCITNDWFTGLIPAYAKVGAFGQTFKGTTFLHIAHNLEPSYEGRLFPSPREGALEYIHQLPREWLVNPHWATVMINPSRCAIMLSDQWSTVSPSYKEDLLNQSPLADLLRQKTKPFAFPNGIPIEARIKKLNEAAPDHLSAKKLIQKKYFNYADLDDSVPLLAFVGRITTQKGVHLILDAAEQLIQSSNFKVNILVGGMVNMKEEYSAKCAHKMWHLKHKYPNCFWADPNQFFTDGSLVNRGTDFGLMPSIFEPGGIVQHEFFVGGTPVIAFKTGGLKDSVFEYNWDSETGNGYTFESHNVNDFVFACERALGTFKNKAKYLKLRENAFNSTMDGDRVSRAWLGEFFRLRGKIFVDQAIIKETLLKASTWSPAAYKPLTSFEELFGIEKGMLSPEPAEKVDIDFGAEEERDPSTTTDAMAKVVSHFERDDKLPHVFTMHNNGPRYQKVELCGTFDAWKTRHSMSFDSYTNQWFITLHLGRGQYDYKYVVNGSNWVVNDKEPKAKDAQGNVNNQLIL